MGRTAHGQMKVGEMRLVHRQSASSWLSRSISVPPIRPPQEGFMGHSRRVGKGDIFMELREASHSQLDGRAGHGYTAQGMADQ